MRLQKEKEEREKQEAIKKEAAAAKLSGHLGEEEEMKAANSHQYGFTPFERITLYKNGEGSEHVKSPRAIVVRSIIQLLNDATKILNLDWAARRLFLPGGKEVFVMKDIIGAKEVVVSCGEPFVPWKKEEAASDGASKAKSPREIAVSPPRLRPMVRKGQW